MATNIDKALYPAPQGLDVETDAPDALEVEVVDDSAEEGVGEDGSMVVALDNDPTGETEAEHDFDDNLVDVLEESEVQQIATDLLHSIDQDKNSRSDWEKTYVDGLSLLGLKIENRTQPWDGACGVVHPMITEAVVRFQAETITETFPAQGPVKAKIVGAETPEKKDAAARVQEDMNYELTEVMPEFRPEHERMLWSLPATGAAFKKVYYDPSKGRQVSVFIPAEDVILPYGTTDLHSCERVTHVMRKTTNELVKLQEQGFYTDTVDIGDAPKQSDEIQNAKDKETGFSDINDERHVVFEVHVDLVIKGDTFRKEGSKVALPYVLTVIKDASHEVLAIRRNWREDDPLFLKRQHFVQYQYVPGFGPYGYGLFHLIGGYAKGATSILRQLVDAGTLANLPGGLKTRGLRIKGDDTPIAPGEFRDVDVGSGKISENIMTLPYGEPSSTLALLLEKIVEEGRRFAATADMEVSDMSAQAPVGTTLALLERQLKVLTAVQARVHFSLKQELKLLKGIICDYTDEDYEYDPDKGGRKAKKSDYEMTEVIPVSDPNAATMSQRVVQYQAVVQMAQMAPEIYDLPQLHREMLEVLGIKNAAKLVPLPDDLKPTDPVSENMALLKSEPVKVFSYQDHESHVRVHMMAMQDPTLQQLIGQNPKAGLMMAAMHAHIAEHAAWAYRQQIEAQLGMALPPEETDLPPEAEVALSQMMAQAGARVLALSQAKQAAQAAQQAAQDPMVQLQMRELAVKEKEAATKEKKVTGDLAAKSDEIDIKRDDLTLRAMQAGVDTARAVNEFHAENEREGFVQGAQIGQQQKQAAAAQQAAQMAPPAKPPGGMPPGGAV
jgi:hypothetical protein